ncbi:unnamed protein product, partial [Mesorhabditis belari]|uniref:Uncharacterized protein n=1 Tax=Mesorhabditis belari TaxID=2138241 RepID=A0AAF3FPG8_9BILA
MLPIVLVALVGATLAIDDQSKFAADMPGPMGFNPSLGGGSLPGPGGNFGGPQQDQFGGNGPVGPIGGGMGELD